VHLARPIVSVLISLSPCALQLVSAPRSLGLFPFPDVSLLYTLQIVSAPRSLVLFPFPDVSLLCTLQEVSVPRSLVFFLGPEFPLRCPGSECPSVARFVSMS